jgi:hypothetical protein
MLLCLATDEDDDANAAEGNEATKKDKTEPTVNQQQAADILALATEVGADIPKMLKYIGYPSIPQIPASQYSNVVAVLEKKRQAA